MKAGPICKDCLKDLARRVVALSGGDGRLTASALDLVDTLCDVYRIPTEVSKRILRYVGEETGVCDPYAERKEAEFRQALAASLRLKDFFPDTLEGALRASAFGNGGDFFMEHSYDADRMEFEGEVAKIEQQVYISSKIMVLGDNPGDFVFDLPLLRLLRREGKEVWYAVKKHPVQNDMSMPDVERFGARGMWDAIIPRARTEVGIRREEMTGRVRECWEDGSMIIAKGMGNYETISEYDSVRPVVYVMAVKCGTVARSLGERSGRTSLLQVVSHG